MERGIIPCFIRKGDIFDYGRFQDKQTNAHRAMKDKLHQRYIQITGKHDFDNIIEPMIRHGINKSKLSEFVKICGYIGAIDSNSQIPSQIVIFDPKNIRSIFAKFDPKKIDSENIMS